MKYLCYILHFLIPRKTKSVPKDPKRILVFSTTGIGDALFDSVAIKSLKLAYPNAEMIVGAHQVKRALCEMLA